MRELLAYASAESVRVDDEYKSYNEQGFIGPLKAVDPAALRGVSVRVLKEFKRTNYSLLGRRNRHLDWSVAHRLSVLRPIIDVASRILGRDLVLWRSNFFLGTRGRGVGWHQDEYRTLLARPTDQISVHLAITEARSDNCVMVIPGSHRMARGELEQRGFRFVTGTDEDGYGAPGYLRDAGRAVHPVKMTMQPGEFFLFHPLLLHASVDATEPRAKSLQRAGVGEMVRGVMTALSAAVRTPRMGLGLRITVPDNGVLPAAFSETLPRPDRCVILS